MRLGETVSLMVQGGRSMPEEVDRITQAINRFRPADLQLDSDVVTPLELMAALESLDPAIKEVLKNVVIETVEDPAMPYSEGKTMTLKRMGVSKRMLAITVGILILLFSVNSMAVLYTIEDSEIVKIVLSGFIELIKVLMGQSDS